MSNQEQSNAKNVSLSLIAEYGTSDSDSEDAETRSNNTGNESDVPLSEMVLKNNIINACAHGPLARPRDEEVTRHMIIDSCESGVLEYEVTEYREVDSDSESSSSDSSDSDVDSVKDVDGSSGDELDGSKTTKPEAPKVNGELDLDDLAPIEDLAISLPASQMTKIGTIASIVDRLVIVRAFPDTPAVDLDSVLFLDNGAKALGKVFDVFGPVTEPHYCVRFNSTEHIKSRGVQPNMDVFIAPETPHTNYVFLANLMKMKGSDASWLNDIEPPSHQIEYSDDEEERRANRARKEQRKQNDESSENDGETSKNTRKLADRRNQRPSDSSSRFGSGPSRGRNPFTAGSRRNNPHTFPRFARPWNMEMRTPPPHNDPRGPFSAPPNLTPPMFPPMFSSSTPPPFMNNRFRFGGPPFNPPGFENSIPYHTPFMMGNRPRLFYSDPPPPPGT